MGRAQRRHAVRRRCRPAGSRRRQERRRSRDLPQPARADPHAARHVRGLARTPGRLDVWRARHGHEGLLHDRIRACAQPGPRRERRGSLRRAVDREAGTAAAELQGDRRSQPGTAADHRRGGRPADAAPGRAQARRGRAARRRPHRRAVRRRSRPRGGLHHQAQRRLRHEARMDRRSRTGDRAHRPRRRGLSQCRQALHGGRDPQDRRVPARRHDELARRASRGRADRARCRPGPAGPRRSGSQAPDPGRPRA